ncbi:uncharacterized protein [Elaeis guineensis]|uniref:Chaperone protein dnaJ 20, chloroplastic n=1 Tax=Elaeis guineensis var. tenera TaxID=51953 RepID=A0A6I9SIG4_ELAGV|nr:chaperone protein dnaJ 20, chloroplastic [Elaeis guineensis]
MRSLSSSFTPLREPPFTSLCPLFKPSLFSTYRRTPLRVSAVSTVARPQSPQAATMYELLAVAETAGPAEIKKAYRRQAQRWHPDACRSTSEKPFFAQQFMRAREAYEVLSDQALRRDYDLSLRAGGASVSGGATLRAGGREGFGDWEAQLEGLWRRAARPRREPTWGSRMRNSAAHRTN